MDEIKEKAYSSKTVVEEIVMVLSSVDPLNDLDATCTYGGITISSRDVQSENALTSILLTVGRRVTTESDLHPKNEAEFMTAAASVILVNDTQSRNA